MAKGISRSAGMRLTDRYCITGELGRGAMGEVHRAFPFQDPSSEVAIKIIQRNRKLGPSDLLRFQKEAALMSQLHHQNIISFHELGIFEGEGDEGSNSGYYIVMEYARGYNLRDSLERDGRKDLPYFFQVGLQVAEALDYTHGKNIIHRDIKPHNIIVTQASKDERGVLVKVLDFGVARLAEAVNANKDGEQNLAIDEQAGTPLYMAPEVTASSFGASDHRVDLYSLGCVLYEVLTGHPPFHGNTRDALERAHQHDEPQQLINLRPDVPVAVAAIIHKLLNKRPDERYQTAFALQADLLRAKMLYEQNGRRMSSFSLGLKDRIYAVSAQLPLVGRKEELASLKDEYEKVNGLSGRSRMTVVSGSGGIGKTRLLSEFKTVLSKDRIKFVQGLFTQHENTLPFNALANAFNEILMRMLKIGGVDADNLSRKVKTIVGPDAHLIATVVPGLRVYLGDLSNVDVPSKVDETSFLRFAKAFSDFVRCLAPENQPLVFMFDDLHWADDKSLELVDQFFSNANSLKFHLVLSYQTDCRSLSPRFVEFLNKFRQLKRRFSEISLSPLATADVSALAKIALRHDDLIPDDFVHYIEKRSSGIPVRIVELLRRLVANDVIRLDGRNLQWEFDSKSLAQGRVQLHAIDIVLGRIKEFEGHDLAVLQAASVAGQTFHYEMLLLGDKHPGSRVLNVMERALDEGLIVRYSGKEDLNHLGKAYMFTHLKVRAAIYDAMSDSQKKDAHYDMAKCFMSLIKKPTGPQLFAITHHLNIYASLSNDNEEVDQIRLQYNVMSGDEAKMTSSPQAAEKYFDISLEICNKWPRISARSELIAEIVERLADVNASQKKYGLALERYRELLSMPISIDKKTAIAARTVGFQMVGGLISDALKLMGGVLDKLGKEIPRGTFWAQTRTLFWIVWDVFDLRRHSRTVQGLRKVYDNHNRLGDRSDRRYPAAKIYHLASVLHGRNDIRTAMVAQDLGMTEVVNGRAPISSAIKIVADRAALIASLGSIRGSYRLFDLCANIAQKANYERALGYILLRRAESVDYIKGRHEDVSDNIRQAWSRLNPREDRLAFAQALTFKQYRELVRCNFSGVVSLGALMPDIVQTRNWHSQISVAITLYSFLLQGKRNKIVDEGTRFMRRREAVAARVDDLFSQVVLAMLTFSRGDTDPARHAFDRLVKLWVGQGNDGKRESLLPWQDDFISLFVCTYPVLFEQEYGRPLMRTSEMLALLKAMRLRGLLTIRQRRAVQLLLWARTSELLNKHQAVSKNYDVALRSSKEAGNLLVQTLCYMWFGVYLLDRGQTANRDYIRRAYSHARRNHMDGVAGWIRKAAEKRKVTITADVASNIGRAGAISAQIGEVMPTLAGQALSVVAADIDDQIPFEKSLVAVMSLLSHHHPGRAVLFLSNSPNKYGCIYPETPPGDVSRIYDGVSLYFNLRSTLTMHLYHANWLHEGASASVLYSTVGDPSPSMSSSVSDHSPQRASYRGDLTEVVDVPSRQISETHEASSLSGNGSSNSVKPGREVSGMFALVPVRVQGETIGVILIEELGAIHAVDLNATRRDLDLFGIHIGSLVESKLSQDFGKSNIALKHPLYKHEHGGFLFEDCSWLNFKLSGKMRTGREASWYVGLQWSADQYVVAYCCVRGEPTLRDQYSSEVFRQVLTTRELARMSGRAKFEVSDLRSELGGLFTRNGTSSKMDELLFAFSIFDRTSPMVESGHFGGARPIVVSSENKVEAFNQVPVQLRDGRDVRYWEVVAQLDDQGLYILSFDTSKIRPQVGDLSTNRRTNEASTIPEGGKSTKRFIESAMSRNELPRYYLTVTRRVENLGLNEDGPSTEKKPA